MKGSALPASFLNTLRAERDPRAEDAAFYTGLGAMVLRSIERELRLMRAERAMYEHINDAERVLRRDLRAYERRAVANREETGRFRAR